MQIRNYNHIATIAKIENQAIFELTRIGYYYAIFYYYPLRTRIIKYKNLLEACEDFVKRMQFIAKTYEVKFTKAGEIFVKNPNEIILYNEGRMAAISATT